MMEIKIQVTSRNGDDMVVCHSVLEAKQVIQKHEEEGKWLFVNGNFTKTSDLTDQDIIDAQQIRMVSQLQGG